MKQPRKTSKKKTPPVALPTPPVEYPPALTFWPMFWKASFLSITIAALMLLITGIALGIWSYGRFRQFLSAAEISQGDFIRQIKSGWQVSPIATNGYKNLLVLGTDSTVERGDVPALTDTMMLVSIDLQGGKINTLPLPRDLWNEEYQTKINALLAYGYERDPAQPEKFPQTVIASMTQVPIHQTLVLSLNQLEILIDLIGGVEINVKQGFTDTQYPRAGVDIATERDPAVLYETIAFESGTQTLDGPRAMQYIRSRHSEDDQGHDLARGQRQQQVIESVLAKLTNPKLPITQPQLAGAVYRFYDENFGQTLPLSELVSTAKTLLQAKNPISFVSHQLTAIDDDPVNGVLDNPAVSARYQNQWVYVIPTQEKFISQIHNAFFNQN